VITVRKTDFSEGNNHFASVQRIRLILNEVDAFLITNELHNATKMFLNFFTPF
jgi:hypothetical protein